MLGFGLWQLRRRDRSLAEQSVRYLAPVLVVLGIACSSTPPDGPIATPASPVISERAQATPEASFAETKASPTATAVVSAGSPVGAMALPSIAELVDRVSPGVAAIAVQSTERGLFADFTDEGAGSGIIVRSDGYILTNAHVIESADEIKVSLPNGETYEAVIIGEDRLTDLAVIKIEADGLAVATFTRSDDLRVGDWVVAMGNALALKGGPTVTLGIVSATGRSITTERARLYDLIQTDAAINDGNSGGPLVNLQGEIIGVNTAIFRQAQGIGFAVSSSVAVPIADILIERGRVVRPLIGLAGDDVTPAVASELDLAVTEGALVTRISPGGPAYEAGVRVGDVIVKINDEPTPDMGRFLGLLWSYDVGDTVRVEYVREGETRFADVLLAERPPDG